MSLAKLEALRRLIGSLRSCLVAYSGGVDSVFLAYVAHQVLGAKSLAVIADSPSLPRRELAEAVELAERFGFSLRVIRTGEFQNAEYVANPANRCYFCKRELFSQMLPLARAQGFEAVLYGENASDTEDHRPGSEAAAELQVRAPLKEVGLTKHEIRILSGEMGLPTADKPQMACLSSRVPYGEVVTPAKLGMIEGGENVLKDLGFVDVRLRHHELHVGSLARIEVAPGELGRFLIDGMASQVATALRAIGYQHVTLDLLGYRRGSSNEAFGQGGRIPLKEERVVAS